ncbi:MAG TPA: tRNA dihydrouridine synthase DusB [Candidatus Kapabacteria bacterium]|nr:tRNA dihydrouridine synthase DusB [Candidatus Kapabacteria bacterium]HPO62658.1 tRNA dihydrouridine synthase DusB [Candidatus Kapabacteria bacterium]
MKKFKLTKMLLGKYTIDNGVLLAPMESITDLPFRVICKKMGADIVYTEFIASEALIRDVQRSLNKMEYREDERPIAVQIFGSKTESMVESAKIVEESGADFVDINYGCWVKKVVNNYAGAALLKDLSLMEEMTSEVVKAVNIPVTVKTRLGWDERSINILEVAKMLENTGISALTIHCRTRDMAMRGNADWSWINKVKEIVKLPIILNGDVRTPQDAKRAFDQTNCDAVMIGRAAVGNPFLFKQVKAFLKNEEIIGEPTLEERIETMFLHLDLNIESKGFPRGLYEFRKHYTGYLKGLHNCSQYRQRLVVAMSVDEVHSIIDEFLKELKVYEDTKNILP